MKSPDPNLLLAEPGTNLTPSSQHRPLPPAVLAGAVCALLVNGAIGGMYMQGSGRAHVLRRDRTQPGWWRIA